VCPRHSIPPIARVAVTQRRDAAGVVVRSSQASWVRIRSLEVIAQSAGTVPEPLSYLVECADAALDQHTPHPQQLAVQVVLADEFGPAVEDAWRLGGHLFGAFDRQRLGGQVHAKAISTGPASARVIIDNAWRVALPDDGVGFASQLGLYAHELCHPRLDRLRIEASADGLVGDLETLHGSARWIVHNATDELRCDLAADTVLQALLTSDSGHGAVPVTLAELRQWEQASYVPAALDAFEEILPAWRPVLEKRFLPTDINVFNRVARDTGRLLTVLAHAEAEARSVPVAGVFAVPALAEHPVGATLRPAWQQICVAYDATQAIADIATAEDRLLGEGCDALIRLWKGLGFILD
jgi:hypothetical protein